MTSEVTSSLSTKDNTHDSSSTVLQDIFKISSLSLLDSGGTKLQGQMSFPRELFLNKKSLNIQLAKKKQACKWRISEEARDIKRLRVQETVFRSPKAIKELNLQFTNMGCKQHRKVDSLLENIKKINSLQKLSLNFSWMREDVMFKLIYPQHNCSIIHNIALCEISHALQRLTSLRTLSFHFTNSDFNDEGLASIERILKRMRNLKNISLNFSQCSLFTGVGLDTLCKAIKKIKTIQIVSLELSKCIQITENDFYLVLQNLHGSPTLQAINLRCSQISNLRFQNLHLYLTQLTSIKRLSLNFSECQVNDKDVEVLCFCLKKLTSLPNLALNLARCPNFTENGLHCLSKSLQTLTNLKGLSLSFGSWHLYDTGLKIFAESLKKLTSLQSLNLDFMGCSNLTSSGAKSLSEALQDLLCLETISVDFTSCYNINNQALKSISDSLEKLVHLKNINLKFSGSID